MKYKFPSFLPVWLPSQFHSFIIIIMRYSTDSWNETYLYLPCFPILSISRILYATLYNKENLINIALSK